MTKSFKYLSVKKLMIRIGKGTKKREEPEKILQISLGYKIK